MKYLIKLLLFIAIADLAWSVSVATNTKMLDQQDFRSWGRLSISLAQETLQKKDDLNDLNEALKFLLLDLENRAGKASSRFEQTEKEHDNYIKTTQEQFNDARLSSSDKQSYLQNYLYLAQTNLQASIDQSYTTIQNIDNYLKLKKLQREEQRQKFEKTILRYQESIGAVDDSIALLNNIASGGLSFIQSRTNLQEQFNALVQMLKKESTQLDDLPIVESLVSMGVQQFADTATVLKVLKLFSSIRADLNDDLVQATKDEQANQDSYEAEKQQKNKERSDEQIKSVIDRESLDFTNKKIAEIEEMVTFLNGKVQEYGDAIKRENQNFDLETQIYNDLIKQIESEKESCQEAINIISEGRVQSFAEYRSKSHIVDQQSI